MKDPYQVLGVGCDADAEEIKRAYRRLAKKLHPDLHPGDPEVEQAFKDVSQAYAILGDGKRRKRFDRGEIDANGQERRGWGGFHRQYAGRKTRTRGAGARKFDFGADLDVEDILSEMFGGGTRTAGARRRGNDVSYTAPVDFLDAAVGAKKRLRLSGGKVLDLVIPPGTSDRQTLRLKGQGAPGSDGAPPGD
ncbi:MAG: J domain-containing protein, partial [Alphaproteobacteria bacterium]